jgi:hypothetical protein
MPAAQVAVPTIETRNTLTNRMADVGVKKLNNELTDLDKINLNFEGKILKIDDNKSLINFSAYFKPVNF